MNRHVSSLALALLAAAALPIAPAQATGAPRTFVSAAGSDSNNCTNVATPCRHMAAAFTATAPDGEIYVLDPANYGSLTITHGVSIEGHGWASIAPVSGSAAITINANAGDKINVIGVVLDGTAVTNTTGILFNSGGSLNVQDSVIRNFSGSIFNGNGCGIIFEPNSPSANHIFVSNTLVSDNSSVGIYIGPTGSGRTTGALDHVAIKNTGGDGLDVETSNATMNVTVSDGVISDNAGNGIGLLSSLGTTVAVMVRNTTIINNDDDGLDATGAGATIRVTRSTITGNGTGWAVNPAGVGLGNGAVLSYADNNIDTNGSGNTAPPTTGLVYK